MIYTPVSKKWINFLKNLIPQLLIASSWSLLCAIEREHIQPPHQILGIIIKNHGIWIIPLNSVESTGQTPHSPVIPGNSKAVDNRFPSRAFVMHGTRTRSAGKMNRFGITCEPRTAKRFVRYAVEVCIVVVVSVRLRWCLELECKKCNVIDHNISNHTVFETLYLAGKWYMFSGKALS